MADMSKIILNCPKIRMVHKLTKWNKLGKLNSSICNEAAVCCTFWLVPIKTNITKHCSKRRIYVSIVAILWRFCDFNHKIHIDFAITFASSGKIGRRYFLFVCPKLPKMNQKFCYLSQRTQRKQRCAYTKNDVRLWDFGTLKSHSLKVSVQFFIPAWHA